MSTLHIYHKEPSHKSDLELCLTSCDVADTLLLTGNSVYALLPKYNSILSKYLANQHCYLLEEDVQARGLTQYISPDFKLINYAQFVQLSVDHDKTISW